ncbi:hypothetical protein IscW_ISCW024564, partial [Ixodes scapularis]
SCTFWRSLCDLEFFTSHYLSHILYDIFPTGSVKRTLRVFGRTPTFPLERDLGTALAGGSLSRPSSCPSCIPFTVSNLFVQKTQRCPWNLSLDLGFSTPRISPSESGRGLRETFQILKGNSASFLIFRKLCSPLQYHIGRPHVKYYDLIPSIYLINWPANFEISQ